MESVKMKKTENIILAVFTCMTITTILLVLYVGKCDMNEERIEYEREVFAPMQSGLKY